MTAQAIEIPQSAPGVDWASVLRRVFLVYCGLVLAFLIAPLLIIVPLSFNAEPYFTFTEKMLMLDPEGWSMRWYEEIANNPKWLAAIENSFVIATGATILATALGTLAAIGLTRAAMPYRGFIMALVLSPMIVPVIIVAAGMSFVYGGWGLTQSHLGLILAHATLGAPFVVITMTATLAGFDRRLAQASQSLGATPSQTFFEITLPLVAPGLASGALFAFAASFDEVVTVLFLGGPEQVTVPRQMWSGIREQISPAILSAATLLIVVAAVLLFLIQLAQTRQRIYSGRVT
jgi:putative spermidine/putrescine transport system permease protein